MPATADSLGELARPADRAARPRRSAALQPLTWLALLVCVPTLLPLLATLGGLLQADREVLGHLIEHVLPEVTLTSIALVLLVGAGTAMIGTGLAALVALCEFPGRRFFSWSLALPLALPGYVAAVAMIGLLDYSGPLAGGLRALGIDYWPEFRSLWGVACTLILVLYPYVYLLARDAFAGQGGQLLEAARMLGMTPWQAFWRTALPMARPWIAGGTALVAMETLADFGTVAAFNVDTFTSAIYKAWFALFSMQSALAVAGVLLLLVLVVLVVERAARSRMRYHRSSARPSARLALGRWSWAASAVCVGVLLTAFFLPVLRLVYLAGDNLLDIDARWLEVAGNTLMLALCAAMLCTLAAGTVAWSGKLQPGKLTAAAARISTLGYGLPGALLAVGLYVPLTRMLAWLQEHGVATSWVGGGFAILMLGYLVRFQAVAHAPLGAALDRIRPSMVESARLCGLHRLERARQIYVPLLRGGAFTAAVLVIIDVIKEMPITLMTRPFGWDTLATRVFEYSNEGMWAEAALPALLIVTVSWLPVFFAERATRAA